MSSLNQLMKPILIVTTLLISIGCSTPEEKELKQVRKNSEEVIKNGMGNPKSYEFISIVKESRVITQGDNIDQRIKSFTSSVETWKSSISNEITLNEYTKSLFPNIDVTPVDSSRLQESIKLLELIEEWSKSVDRNEIGCYTYTISFRGENSLGGMVVTKGTVYTKPDLSVENIDIGSSNPLYTCGEKEEYFNIVLSTQNN